MRILKLVIMVAIISSYLCMFNRAENVPFVRQEQLGTAMAATGASLQEVSVNGWAKLPSAQLSDAQLKEIVQTCMAQLDIKPEDYKITANQTAQHSLIRADTVGAKFRAVAIAQVVHIKDPMTGERQAEAYLVVNIDGASQSDLVIPDWRQKISAAINNFNGSPRITTCLVGWLDGKLKDEDLGNNLNKAFKAVDADVVDTLSSANFVSYTGYSPAIDESLQYDGKKVNLNMAMRYSPQDNRTYVIIGSPVITKEY